MVLRDFLALAFFLVGTREGDLDFNGFCNPEPVAQLERFSEELVDLDLADCLTGTEELFDSVYEQCSHGNWPCPFPSDDLRLEFGKVNVDGFFVEFLEGEDISLASS